MYFPNGFDRLLLNYMFLIQEKGTSSALHTTSSSDPAANTMSENNLLEQFIAIATSDGELTLPIIYHL